MCCQPSPTVPSRRTGAISSFIAEPLLGPGYLASATGSLYRSPLAIIAHAILASLLASAIAATHGPPLEQRCQPRPMFGAMLLRAPDHGECAHAEQGAQIAIALLGDAAELLPAATRGLFWHQSNPGREVPTGSKCSRIGDAGDERCSECGSDAGNGVEPSAGPIRSGPAPEPALKNADLLFERIGSDRHRDQAGAHESRPRAGIVA